MVKTPPWEVVCVLGSARGATGSTSSLQFTINSPLIDSSVLVANPGPFLPVAQHWSPKPH